MNIRCAWRAMLAAMLAACATGAEHIEKITIVAPGATATDTRTASYEATLTAVVNALEREIGLPRVEVPLVLFPTRRAFEQGLANALAGWFAGVGALRIAFEPHRPSVAQDRDRRADATGR